jgi:ornithine decarboxylase
MHEKSHLYSFPAISSAAERDETGRLARIHGTPLLVIDCDIIREQYRRLSLALPETVFFYAVKALPHEDVIATLHQLGCSFDLASSGETALLEKCGISGRDAIYTHPVKQKEDIERAIAAGCRIFVADNAIEIEKLKQYRKKVRLLIRAGFRSRNAVVDLAKKYGCMPEDVPELAAIAARAGIKVAGISFHVGSQSITPDAHVNAIRESGEIARHCRRRRIADMELLDIGGGFPVSYAGQQVMEIEEFCLPVRKALVSLPDELRVIAEPGRFLVAPAARAISSVTGKAWRGNRMWYYLDDGIYGSYSGMIFDHARYHLEPQRHEGRMLPSVLAGPTCDSIDIIAEKIMLPELEIGDLITGYTMGAYTAATATDFNMLQRAKIITINRMSERQACLSGI